MGNAQFLRSRERERHEFCAIAISMTEEGVGGDPGGGGRQLDRIISMIYAAHCIFPIAASAEADRRRNCSLRGLLTGPSCQGGKETGDNSPRASFFLH